MRHLPPWRRGLSLLLAVLLPSTAMPAPDRDTTECVTLDELQAAYPGFALQQVSAGEFARLTGPLQVAQLIVTPEALDASVSTGSIAPLATPPGPASTNAATNIVARTPGTTAQTGSARTTRKKSSDHSTGGSIYIQDTGSLDSSEAAVIVFVLAGVVVIAAAIIYSGALLANWALSDEDVPGWADLSARWMYFSGDSHHGYMAGAALALGLEGSEADVGAVLEGGYLDADVATLDDAEVEVADAYWMAGLSVRWRMTEDEHPPIFEAELLAGTASSYDLLSRASFAFTWSLAGPWRAGLRFGALYLDVAGDEGPLLQAEDDFNLLGGLETSLRF